MEKERDIGQDVTSITALVWDKFFEKVNFFGDCVVRNGEMLWGKLKNKLFLDNM